MYRKKTSSWLKHWDFILLDLILLELSYLLAHWLYHGTAYYREAPLYRNVFFAIAAIDLVVGLMMGSYKGILRRGYWLETKAVAKHAIIVTVCVIAYLFAMKESSNYSRVVIFAFPIISICVLYIGRILLKKWLSKHRGPASGKRAILLIGGKNNYREIVEAFTSNPYSEFHVMGIGIIDAKENEIPNYHGFPVFCGESSIEDFAQLNWVDEALFSIPTELAIKEQIDLYKADFIICCGTEYAFMDACYKDREVDWKMTSRGIWYFRDSKSVVISFSHPEARVKDAYLFYALTDAVKEIMRYEKFEEQL